MQLGEDSKYDTVTPPAQISVRNDQDAAIVASSERAIECSVSRFALVDRTTFLAKRFFEESSEVPIVFDQQDLHTVK